MTQLKRLICVLFIILTIISLDILIRLYEKSTKVEFGVRSMFDRGLTSKSDISNHSNWIREFAEHELRIYSQNGEDGVLLWIFSNIGTINSPPRFVEFGVENGVSM